MVAAVWQISGDSALAFNHFYSASLIFNDIAGKINVKVAALAQERKQISISLHSSSRFVNILFTKYILYIIYSHVRVMRFKNIFKIAHVKLQFYAKELLHLDQLSMAAEPNRCNKKINHVIF